MATHEAYYEQTTCRVRRSTLKSIDREYAELRERDPSLNASPENWGEREVLAIMADMRARGLSHATQKQRLSILKKLLEFVGNGVLGKLKATQPHVFPKADSERKGSLRPDDLETVLAAAKSLGGWTGECASFCLGMFAYTGVRTSELVNAHYEDLNVRNWTFKVRHPKGEKSYGKKRILPVPDDMRPIAKRYLKERETVMAKRGVLETVPLVFAMKDHTKPVGATMVNSWTDRIVRATGVQFSPHMLRRTYGQMLLDRGANIQTVSLMLGHASTETTERHYCRKNEDDARTEVLEAFRQSPSTNSPKLTPQNELAGYA